MPIFTCGTYSAYRRHQRQGETPCARCADAAREAWRQKQRAMAAALPALRPCRRCGTDIPRTGSKGRPPSYCSDECRLLRHRVRDGTPDTRSYACVRCGKTWERPATRGQLPRFCSEACSNSSRAERRRASERDAFVEDIDRTAIFERDGWTCQLCGDPVDREAVWPDPLSSTIDHILPLAAGGLHETANVQCAHARCNIVKGPRVANDLRLVG